MLWLKRKTLSCLQKKKVGGYFFCHTASKSGGRLRFKWMNFCHNRVGFFLKKKGSVSSRASFKNWRSISM